MYYFSAQVPRFPAIQIEFLDEDLQEHEEELDGFKALAFQQVYDMVHGKTYFDWRVSFGQIFLNDAYKTVTTNFKILY